MSVETVVLNGLGLIPAEIVTEIRAGVEDGVALFRRHAKVENIGISVHDSGFVGDETGFGGISYGSQSFALYVDPDCEAARLNTRLHAAATTVHELHHCLRQRVCPLRPYSQMCAGDVLVLEGLAVHCEAFLGYGEAPAVQGVGIDGIRPLIERIAPIIGDHQADWAWIYERNGLKHGALYAMRYHLVAPYLSANGTNPVAAIDAPWRAFLDAFQASLAWWANSAPSPDSPNRRYEQRETKRGPKPLKSLEARN
jgi:uncharacterized protein YjaZ